MHDGSGGTGGASSVTPGLDNGFSYGDFMLEPLDGPVHDSLDLHGMTGIEAVTAVTAFVHRVHRRQPGALVHVITGKGRGSPGRPVLKTRVKTLLRSDSLPAAAWAEDLDGGGYLIRLKNR